jgi:cytochrome c
VSHKTFHTNSVVLAVLLALAACSRRGTEQKLDLPETGEAKNAPAKIEYYGCASCHVIPGVAGADGLIGPPLDTIGSRAYVGGVVRNSPDNLVRWIQNAPGLDPKTAMPRLDVPEMDAREIAAYLYTLR